MRRGRSVGAPLLRPTRSAPELHRPPSRAARIILCAAHGPAPPALLTPHCARARPQSARSPPSISSLPAWQHYDGGADSGPSRARPEPVGGCRVGLGGGRFRRPRRANSVSSKRNAGMPGAAAAPATIFKLLRTVTGTEQSAATPRDFGARRSFGGIANVRPQPRESVEAPVPGAHAGRPGEGAAASCTSVRGVVLTLVRGGPETPKHNQNTLARSCHCIFLFYPLLPCSCRGITGVRPIPVQGAEDWR